MWHTLRRLRVKNNENTDNENTSDREKASEREAL